MRVETHLHLLDVVRCALVYKIVQPVGKEQMRMPSPRYDRGLFRVVIGEIIDGDCNGFALRKITLVFVLQGVCVVFRMPRNENLSAVFGANCIHARLF